MKVKDYLLEQHMIEAVNYTTPDQPAPITRVEVITDTRGFVKYAPNGHEFEISLQDGGRTLKLFLVKKDT